MPLLNMTIRREYDHAQCRRATRDDQICPNCRAERYLTADDWHVLEFYRRVADQVINQAPFGTKDGSAYTTPRLEAYEAACRLHGVPEGDRPWLVETACWLHHAREKRHEFNSFEVRAMKPEDLAPPEFGDA